MMYVFVAPPTLVGVWSMALVLWQLNEYYYYYYYVVLQSKRKKDRECCGKEEYSLT